MSLVDDARAAARAAGINPDTFVRQIQQESGFNPNARSPAGAEGIAQFMPGTAAGLGINPWDPVQALNAAARYMANSLRAYGGNYAKALAAYNAGGGAVNAAIARGGRNWQRYLPSETQNYIHIILGGKGNPPPVVPPVSTPIASKPPSQPPSQSTPHTPSGLPQALSIAPHTAPHTDVFGQPYTLSLAPHTPVRPQPLFQQPQAFSVPRQPSTPVQKPKPTRPQPAPKPVPAPKTATQKKTQQAGKRVVGGPS